MMNNNKKYILLICALVLFLLAMAGYFINYNNEEEQKEEKVSAMNLEEKETFPLAIRNYDGEGHEIETVYRKPPEKIIAIWQNSVETLLQLGAGDKIITAAGIDNPLHLTKEDQNLYNQIPLLTKHTLSQESAVTLNPDFILGWRFDFTGKANSIGTFDFWHNKGTAVYMTNMNGADYLEKHTVEDELRYIYDVGRITGHADKAKEIIHGIEKDLQEIEVYARAHPREQKVLCVFYMDRELHIYTPRTLPGDIISRLGGTVIGREAENVGQDEVMSYENLLLENPDVLFIQSSPEQDETKLAQIYEDPRFQDLSCVKNKRVYTIPFYTIRDPAVRVADAVKIIANGLYPERDSHG